MKLERKQMLEVEGGTDTECMRILRHEAGHALDTAFRLHFKRQHRELFGSFAQPYPGLLQTQTEEPEVRAAPAGVVRAGASRGRLRRDVCRLADAAFAVATPLSRLAGVAQARVHRRVDERARGHETEETERARKSSHCPRCEDTLREHYRRKRERYDFEWPAVYDRDLHRIFSDDPRHKHRDRVLRVFFARCVARCDRSLLKAPACTSTRSITCCKT